MVKIKLNFSSESEVSSCSSSDDETELPEADQNAPKKSRNKTSNDDESPVRRLMSATLSPQSQIIFQRLVTDESSLDSDELCADESASDCSDCDSVWTECDSPVGCRSPGETDSTDTDSACRSLLDETDQHEHRDAATQHDTDI